MSLRELTYCDKDLTQNLVSAFRTTLLDKDKYMRLNAATALALLQQGGDKPFQVLEPFLADEDREVRRAIRYAMKEIGLPALPTLKRGLQHKSPLVRSTAANCLVDVFAEAQWKKQDVPQEIVSPLAAALEDTDADVVIQALRALSELGSQAHETIPEISKCVKYLNPDVRRSALIALGGFGPAAKAGLPAVKKALADRDVSVRCASVDALGKIAGKTALPLLEKALADDDEDVRRAWLRRSVRSTKIRPARCAPHQGPRR